MPRALFFSLAVLIWSLAHVYVGRRLIHAARAPRLVAVLGWSLLVTHALLAIVMIVLTRMIDVTLPMQGVLQWATYLGMGCFTTLFVLVILRDIAWLVGAGVARVARAKAPESPSPDDSPRLARRDLFFKASSLGVVGLATGASALGYHEARRLARVVRVKVPVPDLDPRLEGFRIAQISDIHVGPTIRRPFLQAVVDKVNELGADVVAVTGDLVDGHVEEMREEVSPIASLRARHGVFFVTGNHEYYWDGPAWAEEVARQGLRVLVNEHDVLDHDGAPVVVAGVTDYSTTKRHAEITEHATSPDKALEGAPTEAYKILLAHQPKSVWGASEAGADLQLSGHTHGGQFLPVDLCRGLGPPVLQRPECLREDAHLREPWHGLLGSTDEARRALGDHAARACARVMFAPG